MTGDIDRSGPLRVVVMGVSGSGKSTLGAALAGAIGARFIDGDDLHSEANRLKMTTGVPLNDRDRQPWLKAIAAELVTGSDAGTVIAASALKRVYRDTIREQAREVVFIHLSGDESTLRARMRTRENHFMPPTLLASQLADLEPLELDETGLTLSIADRTETLVGRVKAALQHPIDRRPKRG